MLYSIVAMDAEGSLQARLDARSEHVSRLMALRNAGRLVLAGPNPAIDTESPGESGFTGSIIIAEFDALESAKAWVDEDPYVLAGVYECVEVKPFKQALP